MFKYTKPKDSKLESVESIVSQDLRLYRQDQIVGHKILIYAKTKFEKKNEQREKTMKEVRNITFKFFKDWLLFQDDEIVEIDLSEIP